MKYLIVKGWLGFGDRLESLKMAVAYAQKYNLKIYVDWTDPMWSHGDESFYTYFKLNMPSLESLDDIPADATFYPAFWKDRIREPITQELLNDNLVKSSINIGTLNGEYSADVVVSSNVGTRTLYIDSAFFANVFRVVEPTILQKIRSRKQAYPIEKSWGIHIRGTDRLRPNKRLLSVQSLVSLIVNYGGLSGPKMTVVSDDKENALIWKRYFPESFLASELSLQQSSLSGNHNLSKDKLQTSKHTLNTDMLVDFFTLALTSQIFTTCKDSRFTQEARRLHPFVSTILGS
jgi:hypothetical protein